MYLPAPDEALWVGVVRLVLHLPRAQTLKDRRSVVQSVVRRIEARHKVSIAEVGHHENPGAAVVAATVVGNDQRLVRSRMDTIRTEAEKGGDAWLAEVTTWLTKMGEVGAS